MPFRIGLGRRRIHTMWVCAVLASMPDGAVHAQAASEPPKPRLVGIIDGLVSDSALAPLDDVTVSFVGSETRVVTGANGRFRFLEVPEGRHRLLVRRIGHEPVIADVQVAVGDVARMSITLERAATTLKGVRVETSKLSPRLQDFEQRRKLSEGQFLTAAEMEKHPAVSVGDYLQRMRGIRVSGGAALNRRFPVTQSCAMNLYVDNIPRGTLLADLPSPKEIAGIEVYLGPATMPAQFKRPTGVWCGIILIWTRDGSEP